MKTLRQTEVRNLLKVTHLVSGGPGFKFKGQTPEICSDKMKEWINNKLAWSSRESCREEVTCDMPGRVRRKRQIHYRQRKRHG